jgi:hypothetical protein
MANFDELQTLWQSQASLPLRLPASALPGGVRQARQHLDTFDVWVEIQPSTLSGALRRLGRKQDIINIVKALLIVFAFVNTLVNAAGRPVVFMVSMAILFVAAVGVFIEWRIQRGIARLDFSACSVDFVRNAIARMQAQRNPYHTPAYVALFAAVFVGYNLLVVAAWPKLPMERRIFWHAMTVMAPAASYALGRWIRARRFNSGYRPVIERLRLLLELLEENPR